MYKKILAAVAISLCAPVTAGAVVVEEPALVDDVYIVQNISWSRESTERAFWAPGLVPNIGNYDGRLWADTGGTFTVTGETATLVGSAQNVVDNELTFDYALSFTRTVDGVGYCQFNGGKQDCATAFPTLDITSWDFFDLDMGGTFTGTGAMEGLVWEISDRTKSNGIAAHPPQAGIGGNALTIDTLGFSVWIDATLTAGGGLEFSTSTNEYTMYANGTTKGGDINIDLVPTPLPAAAWMLLAGVAGLGAAGRRSRKAA